MEADRGIYLALAELARRYRGEDGSRRTGTLTEYELRCFSQHGEDGVIAEILARIGSGERYFVEFGIESGREGNCVFLADVLGWSGLFLEPDEAGFDALSTKYDQNSRVATINAAVTPDNIEQIFAQNGVPAQPSVLSIDVDGQDYWVWDALGRFRPRLVVIEYNASLPPGRRLTQPLGYAAAWDGTEYFGASLDALSTLAGRKQYQLVHTDLAAINAFFVRDDLAAERFPPLEQIPRRHSPNYFLTGHRHLPDTLRRPYTDLDDDRPAEPERLHSRGDLTTPAPESAAALAARTDFIWHQRFELADGIYTPGVSDVGFLLDMAGMPESLAGSTVLDIGTTNGGAAFVCERRGADRVVAVDIADANWFGFATIKEALGSRVEHIQASIYELPELLGEQFDVVMFWGVLYHLRHPLLALDNVRRLTRGTVSIETAVCDHELQEDRKLPVARFYRGDELGADPSNWFAPSVAALTAWCGSAGLEPTRVHAWPEEAPERAVVVASATAGEPEYLTLSYERPLTCSVTAHGAGFGSPGVS
jgi:SAM-dependent methyltransferase